MTRNFERRQKDTLKNQNEYFICTKLTSLISLIMHSILIVRDRELIDGLINPRHPVFTHLCELLRADVRIFNDDSDF